MAERLEKISKKAVDNYHKKNKKPPKGKINEINTHFI